MVLLAGARQTGKSTLIKALYPAGKHAREYITFDDLTVLAAATSNPAGFIAGLPEKVILDEVQRVPEIFLPLKQSVDEHRKPGRFLMTGSSHVLAIPKTADVLTGQMEVYQLWPLSQGELRGVKEDFIAWAFSAEPAGNIKPVKQEKLAQIMTVGGYPESVARENQTRRNAWSNSYLTTLLQRDVKDLSNIDGLHALPGLLTLIASRAGGLLNHSDLGRSLSLPTSTLRRYMGLLEAVFVTVSFNAWATNIGKRVIKSPKLFLNDTGLLCFLLGVDEERLLSVNGPLGSVLENFVAIELTKQLGWSAVDASLFHFRTVSGQEVDLVVERRDGSLVGIEVKASRTVSEKAFSGLKALREATGKRFKRGVVLYTGEKVVNFESDLTAVPVSALSAKM